MPDNYPKSQRKSPQQSRSKDMVDSILTAAARVLPSTGFDRASTNKVAEVAGVSVGSLYQYFANKVSLYTSLLERINKGQTDKLIEEIESLEITSIEQLVDHIVPIILKMHLDHKNITRAVFMEAPRLGKIQSVLDQRRRVVDLLNRVFTDKLLRHDLSSEQISNIAFVCVNSMIGLLQAVVLEDNISFSHEQLSSEAKNLLNRYLQPYKRI